MTPVSHDVRVRFIYPSSSTGSHPFLLGSGVSLFITNIRELRSLTSWGPILPNVRQYEIQTPDRLPPPRSGHRTPNVQLNFVWCWIDPGGSERKTSSRVS